MASEAAWWLAKIDAKQTERVVAMGASYRRQASCEGKGKKDVSRVQVNVNAVYHALHRDPITSRQRIFVISIGARGLFSWGGVVSEVEPGSVLAWTKATQEVHSVVLRADVEPPGFPPPPCNGILRVWFHAGPRSSLSSNGMYWAMIERTSERM